VYQETLIFQRSVLFRTWLLEHLDNGVQDLFKKKSIRGPVARFVVG